MTVRDGDAGAAPGHRLGDSRDLGQRAGDRAADDDDSHGSEGDRRQGKGAESPDGPIQPLLQLGVDTLRAGIVDRSKSVEILVEGGANAAVCFIVAPLAALGRADLGPQSHQFLAELDELLNALGEFLELLRIVGANIRAPFLHDLGDPLVELEQQIAIALGARNIGRHVDAARLHHHGVDQPVHALDVLRSDQRGLVFIGHRRLMAGIDDGDPGQRHGRGREQRENAVKLGGNGKVGQAGHCIPLDEATDCLCES